ncbi:hypothetical protein V8F20_007481, partial [Naviculisporaceae sp. PSN 640]
FSCSVQKKKKKKKLLLFLCLLKKAMATISSHTLYLVPQGTKNFFYGHGYGNRLGKRLVDRCRGRGGISRRQNGHKLNHGLQ